MGRMKIGANIMMEVNNITLLHKYVYNQHPSSITCNS